LVYYKIRAISGDGTKYSTNYSNTSFIQATYSPWKKIPNKLTDIYEDKFSVFPNPFNPSTTITVQIKENGPIKLAIYNVFGQQIEVFTKSYCLSGNHNFKFDGSNLSSGIYICRLQTQNLMLNTKLMLMK
jgi:hypothetical protein